MKRFWIALLSLLLLLPLTLFTGGATANGDAQQQLGQAGVVIHAVIAKDGQIDAQTGAPALELTVIYSLLREQGQAVVGEKEVQGSEMLYSGPPAKKTTEDVLEEGTWNIVLLTDLSNSGPTQFRDLLEARKILAENLESGPPANFVWHDFAEKLSTTRFDKFLPIKGGSSQDNDKDNLVKAIQASKGRLSKDVCLNAVLKDALNKVKQPAGKKAILLLTHQGDTCSSATQVDEVIEAATSASDAAQRVQIYAIGLGGPTLQAELDKLTQPTGGAAFVKSLSAIKPAIEQTHNLMKGQRRAVFLLYPPQANNPEGKFDATLEVTTDTGVRHAAPFTFFTKRAYTAPPIFIFDRGYSTLGGLQLHFKCVNPGQLEQVQIQLFKSDSPEPIDEIVRKDALAASEKSPGICIITVPRTKLDLGRSYTMRGFVKQQDQPIGPLFAEDKEPTVVFDPKPPTLNVAGFGAPSPTSSQFIITLTSDVETVVDVSLFQANQSNEAVAVRTQTDVALGRQAKTITFTAGDLPTGLYVAQVAWKDNPAVSARSNAVNYAPESLGEWLARIGNGSTTSRLALIGIAAAAIVGLIVVVLLMRSRASSPIKVVPDELTKDQRMRRIQINTSPPSANQPSAMSSAPPPQSPEPSQVNQQPQQPQQPKFSQPKAEPAASGPPAAYIRVLKPANINFKGRIRKTPFAIGRDNTNDGILPVDGASGVSRKKHISLVFHNGQWHVRDEGTPNGTKLNGSRIAPNQLLPLGAQAVLVLGQVEIEFQIEKP